jgi:large subunit ribosomal protein L21
LEKKFALNKIVVLLHFQILRCPVNKYLKMYAIVDIAGQQMKVEKDREYFVNRLEGEEGTSVEFNKVMLVDNDGTISVGKPVVAGAKVTGKIVNHLKADTVLVFKKKRRKGYQKMNGHRQPLSRIRVEAITL